MSSPHVDLDDIRVRYATFRAHAAPERERLARELHASDAIEHVLLETCHRVELTTVEDGPVADGQLSGEPAIRRIFEVVAGFDSVVVAEEQLLGQVRAAYGSALAAGTTGPILNELFRRALRFGRSVRSHARPGTDRSLADLGADWIAAHVADTAATVLVIGTGEMGRRVAMRLAERGHPVIVSSTSGERGGALVEALPGDEHRLHVGAVTDHELDEVAAVAIAVRTRSPILSVAELGDARPRVLDLSMPSAVDEVAAKLLGDRLLTIDELGMQTDSAPILAPSVERRLRRAMEAEVEAFITWLGNRAAADALEVLHAEADAVRRRHLERLRSGGSLDEGQFAAVEAAASAMVGELLHGPSLELRRGGADADTIRRMFGLEA